MYHGQSYGLKVGDACATLDWTGNEDALDMLDASDLDHLSSVPSRMPATMCSQTCCSFKDHALLFPLPCFQRNAALRRVAVRQQPNCFSLADWQSLVEAPFQSRNLVLLLLHAASCPGVGNAADRLCGAPWPLGQVQVAPKAGLQNAPPMAEMSQPRKGSKT
jgi:hypothetical protein